MFQRLEPVGGQPDTHLGQSIERGGGCRLLDSAANEAIPNNLNKYGAGSLAAGEARRRRISPAMRSFFALNGDLGLRSRKGHREPCFFLMP